jgi:hypothetical protein
MALLTGITTEGDEVPVQVDPSGRLVCEGLQGAQGVPGEPGADGLAGAPGAPGDQVLKGTWAPTIYGRPAIGTPGDPYTPNRWWKVGPLVFIAGLVEWSNLTGVGSLEMYGLPFDVGWTISGTVVYVQGVTWPNGEQITVNPYEGMDGFSFQSLSHQGLTNGIQTPPSGKIGFSLIYQETPI